MSHKLSDLAVRKSIFFSMFLFFFYASILILFCRGHVHISRAFVGCSDGGVLRRRYKTGIPLCLASSRGIVTGLRTPPATMLGASFMNCLMPPRARPSQAGQHERFHSAQVNAAHFTRLTPAQRYSFIFF